MLFKLVSACVLLCKWNRGAVKRDPIDPRNNFSPWIREPESPCVRTVDCKINSTFYWVAMPVPQSLQSITYTAPVSPWSQSVSSVNLSSPQVITEHFSCEVFLLFFFCIVYKPAKIWRRNFCLSQRSHIIQLICWFSYRHHKLSCLQFASWNHFPFVIEPALSPCVWWDLLDTASLSDPVQAVQKLFEISGKEVWVVRGWPDPRMPFYSGISTPSKCFSGDLQ